MRGSNPEPSTRVPPDYVSLSNRGFLADLRVPCHRDGNPGRLFHDIEGDVNEIEEISASGCM